MVRRALRLALPAAVLAAVPAPAAELPRGITAIDPAATRTVALDRASAASCLDGASAARRAYTAPADGVLTVRLRGAGDWDLAVREQGTGALAGSSLGFGGREVVQVPVDRGTRLDLRACRRPGASREATLTTRLVRLDRTALPRIAGKLQLVEVRLDRRGEHALEAAGLDVTHDVHGPTANVLLHGTAHRRALEALGLPFRVLDADVAASQRRARRAEAARSRSLLPTGRTTYRTFTDVQAELKQMVAEHPDRAQPITLQHRSFQGREIPVVEIARDVRDGDDGRPVLTIGALHHAREWPSTETAMEFAWDLLRNGGTDPQLRRVLDDVRVVVMPVTNPDAYVTSRAAEDPTNGAFGVYRTATGVALFGGTLGYKRKTCNPLLPVGSAVPCDLAFGVDPNRNYATDWGGPGGSVNPNDQSYRGDGPFSEPETRAVQELSSRLNSPVHMSLHNVAAKILRPPGLEELGFVPDEDAMKELGQLVVDATGYANEFGWQLYDTTATTKDWGYDALGQYSYTIELGPRNGDFHGDYAVNVEREYTGRPGTDFEGLGMREALIRSALYTLREDQTSRLVGRAPAGVRLRLLKAFQTDTFPVCTLTSLNPLNVNTPVPEHLDPDYCTAPQARRLVDERIDIAYDVPADGRVDWVVNPSTRPFERRAGRIEAYTVVCEVNGLVRGETRDVVVDRGQTARIDLTEACR